MSCVPFFVLPFSVLFRLPLFSTQARDDQSASRERLPDRSANQYDNSAMGKMTIHASSAEINSFGVKIAAAPYDAKARITRFVL
ncbi:MAG: hypothetical protein WD066_05465 [Planctomycetaceae bacterium]